MFGKKSNAKPLVRVNKTGVLTVPGEFATVRCLVLRMSDREALIQVTRRAPLPKSFRLAVQDTPRSWPCRLKSVEGDKAYVEFSEG